LGLLVGFNAGHPRFRRSNFTTSAIGPILHLARRWLTPPHLPTSSKSSRRCPRGDRSVHAAPNSPRERVESSAFIHPPEGQLLRFTSRGPCWFAVCGWTPMPNKNPAKIGDFVVRADSSLQALARPYALAKRGPPPRGAAYPTKIGIFFLVLFFVKGHIASSRSLT
jgi:hypothetical protein